MATTVVTGAGGFLGGHLCRELAHRGHEIIALVRKSRPYVLNAHNIVMPESLSIEVLSDILRNSRASVVYHLAGTNQKDDLVALYRANVVYGATLLEAALSSPIPPKVVFLGSAAEYGVASAAGPIKETQECRPLSAYGISKLAQTHHGLAAAARGLPVVVARLFNPIGIGMPNTTAIGSFVNQVAAMGSEGGTLTTGPIHAVRDFIAADDVARLLADLAGIPAAIGQIVNLCSGNGMRLEDLVRLIIQAAPGPVRHEIDEKRGGTSDLEIVVGDTSLIRSLGLAVSPPNFDSLILEMIAEKRASQQ